MKTILAIETSCPVLTVALGTSRGEIFELRAPSPFRHSENLLPLIDKLVKNAGTQGRRLHRSMGDIDAFAINRGPGSFTGLRIGFSLLKGFLAARKRPCFGALSLDMITANIRVPEETRLGVLLDARREVIYSRFYRKQNGVWVPERRLELLTLPQLKRRISEGTYLVGDALGRYRAPLEENFGNRIHFLKNNLSFPRARTLVRWFQTGDKRLGRLKNSRDFLPLYFRTSEAEENRRKGQ